MINGIKRPVIALITSAAIMLSGTGACFAEAEGTVTDQPRDEIMLDMVLEEIPAGVEIKSADGVFGEEPAETFAAKSKFLKVKSVHYDPVKSKVKFKFNHAVKYKNAKVVIRYKLGKNMVSKIKSKKSKELIVKVKKLKYGRRYSYVIKGVRRAGSPVSFALVGAFRAVDK